MGLGRFFSLRAEGASEGLESRACLGTGALTARLGKVGPGLQAADVGSAEKAGVGRTMSGRPPPDHPNHRKKDGALRYYVPKAFHFWHPPIFLTVTPRLRKE